MRPSILPLAIIVSAALASASACAGVSHLHSSDSDYSWSDNGHALVMHSHGDSGIVVDRTRPTPFHGLQAGDVILAVDGHAVVQVEDLLKAVRGHDMTPMTLRIRRSSTEVVVSWPHAELQALFPPPPPPPPPPR